MPPRWADLARINFGKPPATSNTVAGLNLPRHAGQSSRWIFASNNNRALQLAPTTNTANFIGGDRTILSRPAFTAPLSAAAER